MSSDHDRDVMISVRGLGKAYTIARAAEKATTLAEAAVSRLRRPFHPPQQETFWALKDVSFDVRRGDVVGVIGRNGAGKSTLFKILSRITEPTTGQVGLYGRVGSLLEVGTGFSGELTGRENIYLNGTILGMRRAEIAKRFDEIVDFAGVEKFLDTPVKRYSSGMYVRLAFAVASSLDTEILIVDEVLAVGDAEFQQRCLGRIKKVAVDGRTVLFVSHNMDSVLRLCDKGLFLQEGSLAWTGSIESTTTKYLNATSHSNKPAAPRAPVRQGTGEYRFVDAQSLQAVFASDEPKTIRYRFRRFGQEMPLTHISAHVINEQGTTIVQCDSRLIGLSVPSNDEVTGAFTLTQPWLKPGAYTVTLYLCSGMITDCYENACGFDVAPAFPYAHGASPDATSQGIVFGRFDWTANAAQK
jgi:lipopolysaccharide transport system ATP-binding protein